MELPSFLLRKLYKRGSLRETDAEHFAFRLRNPLGGATLVSPPRFVINGMSHEADDVDAGDLDLSALSEDDPYRFEKGDEVELRFRGRLLRGGNRIHVSVQTKEFGRLEFLVEDREAEFCDLPGAVPSDSEE